MDDFSVLTQRFNEEWSREILYEYINEFEEVCANVVRVQIRSGNVPALVVELIYELCTNYG